MSQQMQQPLAPGQPASVQDKVFQDVSSIVIQHSKALFKRRFNVFNSLNQIYILSIGNNSAEDLRKAMAAARQLRDLRALDSERIIEAEFERMESYPKLDLGAFDVRAFSIERHMDVVASNLSYVTDDVDALLKSTKDVSIPGNVPLVNIAQPQGGEVTYKDPGILDKIVGNAHKVIERLRREQSQNRERALNLMAGRITRIELAESRWNDFTTQYREFVWLTTLYGPECMVPNLLTHLRNLRQVTNIIAPVIDSGIRLAENAMRADSINISNNISQTAAAKAMQQQAMTMAPRQPGLAG